MRENLKKVEIGNRSYVKNSPGLHLLFIIDGKNPVELDHYTRLLGNVLKKLGGVINERIVMPRTEKTFKVMNFPGSDPLSAYEMKEYTHRRMLDIGNLLHENIDIFMDYAQMNAPVGGKVEVRRDSWFSFIAESKGIDVYKPYKELEFPEKPFYSADSPETTETMKEVSNTYKSNKPKN